MDRDETKACTHGGRRGEVTALNACWAIALSSSRGAPPASTLPASPAAPFWALNHLQMPVCRSCRQGGNRNGHTRWGDRTSEPSAGRPRPCCFYKRTVLGPGACGSPISGREEVGFSPRRLGSPACCVQLLPCPERRLGCLPGPGANCRGAEGGGHWRYHLRIDSIRPTKFPALNRTVPLAPFVACLPLGAAGPECLGQGTR